MFSKVLGFQNVFKAEQKFINNSCRLKTSESFDFQYKFKLHTAI